MALNAWYPGPQTGYNEAMTHPLDVLSAGEIEAAVKAVRATGRITDAARFARIRLHEPAKEVLLAFTEGDAVDREVCLTIVPGPAADLIETVVAVPSGEVRSWTEVPGVRPGLLFEEALNAKPPSLVVWPLAGEEAYEPAQWDAVREYLANHRQQYVLMDGSPMRPVWVRQDR